MLGYIKLLGGLVVEKHFLNDVIWCILDSGVSFGIIMTFPGRRTIFSCKDNANNNVCC